MRPRSIGPTSIGAAASAGAGSTGWWSRRFTWSVTLVGFALVASACSGDGGAATTTTLASDVGSPTTTSAFVPTGEARPHGGEVVVADAQEPPTLNPFVPGGNSLVVGIVGQGYFAGVYEIDGETLELIPELVTELPTPDNGGVVVNDDGTMTVHYKIREEAQWSDGVPISGADFQFTLETILNPELPLDRTTYQDIVDTEVGEKTFSFTLTAPTTLYELLFARIIPRHAVEGSDFVDDWNTTMWPSAGPFVLETWVPGERISLVRNENYWKTDPTTGQHLPYLDGVTFRFIADTGSVLDAFRLREVDIIAPDPAMETIQALQTLEPEGAVVEVVSGPVWEHLAFQFGEGRLERNPNSLNDNLNYRRALAHALDRERIVDELLAGQVDPIESFVDAYNPLLSQAAWGRYDHDVDTAIALLETAMDEAGVDTVETVFTTTSNNDARVKLAALFAEMFGEVGIDFVIDLEDSQLFFDETTVEGTFDLAEWAWVGAPGLSGLVSLMDQFDPEAPPPGGSNLYYFGAEGSSVVNEGSRRLAELRDEMNTTVDEDVLIPLIAEAENILADQVVMIPLYARLTAAAVWADEVGGFAHNPTLASLTWNIESWYRADG